MDVDIVMGNIKYQEGGETEDPMESLVKTRETLEAKGTEDRDDSYER